MRLLIYIALASFCSLNLYGQHYNFDLIPYHIGNMWGYSDRSANIKIKPKFTSVEIFKGPLTVAKIDSQYCVINQNGDIIYKNTDFTHVVNDGNNFIGTKGPYSSRMYDKYGRPVTKEYHSITGFNQYGYSTITAGYVYVGLLNKQFKEVLTPAYTALEFFTEDLVKVYDDKLGKYGLINLKTNHKVHCQYDKIYPPHEGLLMAIKDGKSGFINEEGREIIPFTYYKATPENILYNQIYNESTYQNFNYDGFYDGLAVVTDGVKTGYINKNGAIVIPFKFEKGFGFQDNHAWVNYQGKWGVIDHKGNFEIGPLYNSPAYLDAKELLALDGFHEGLVAVAKDSLFGYAETSGKIKIPFRFSRAEPFYDGLAVVYDHNNKAGVIDHSGRQVIPFKYKYIQGAGAADTYPFRDGCGIALTFDNKWEIINKRGDRLIKKIFDIKDDIWFQHKLAYAHADGRTYVFDTDGNIRYECDKEGYIIVYSPELVYSSADDAYINIHTGVKYCK